MHCFNKGDVVLGDAYYCSYFLVALLMSLGVDVVFESHGAREIDFRKGQRVGKRDHLVHWRKPSRPEWMDEDLYVLIPDEIEMRETSTTVDIPGHRSKEIVLVTTMKDAKEVTKIALAMLYKQRWHGELDLRNIKTTIGMDMLRCKDPDMVRKEIWAHLLAYNLVRKIMAEAAQLRGVEPRRVSFKGTIQILTAYMPLWKYGVLPIAEVYQHMLKGIGQSLIANRPRRSEPRAVKRRPKVFPKLKGKRQSTKSAAAQGLQA